MHVALLALAFFLFFVAGVSAEKLSERRKR